MKCRFFLLLLGLPINSFMMELNSENNGSKNNQEILQIQNITINPITTNLIFPEKRHYEKFALSASGDLACRSGGPTFYTYYGKKSSDNSMNMMQFEQESLSCINDITFNKDGTFVCAGTHHGDIFIWRPSAKRKSFSSSNTNKLWINELDAHPLNNAHIAIGHLDGISIWDVTHNKCVRQWQTEHSIEHIKYVPNAQLLVTRSNNVQNNIHLYDPRGTVTNTITGCYDRAIGCLAVSHDGIHIAANDSNSDKLLLFDIRKNSTPINTWPQFNFFSLDDILFFTEQTICKAGSTELTSFNLYTFEQNSVHLTLSMKKPVWNKWNNHLYRFSYGNASIPHILMAYNLTTMISDAPDDYTLQNKKHLMYDIVRELCNALHNALSSEAKMAIRTVLLNNLNEFLMTKEYIHYDRANTINKLLQNMPEDAHCPICFEMYDDLFFPSSLQRSITTTAGNIRYLAKCKHILCSTCYRKMINKGFQVCPICRKSFK